MSSVCAGGPTAIWRPLTQSTESQRRACSRSWVAIAIAWPSPASSAISASSRSAAGPVEAGERLVHQQHAGVLDEGAGDQDALALAAGELAEGLLGQLLEADPGERPRAPARARPGRPPPPRGAGQRAHRRHVERRDRVVEARALGLRDRAAGGADPEAAGKRAQLAEQGAQDRRLAAAVGTEQGEALARPQLELDRGDDRRAGAVAERQAARLDQGLIRHPTLPSLKPRAIASALAASMPM